VEILFRYENSLGEALKDNQVSSIDNKASLLRKDKIVVKEASVEKNAGSEWTHKIVFPSTNIKELGFYDVVFQLTPSKSSNPYKITQRALLVTKLQ